MNPATEFVEYALSIGALEFPINGRQLKNKRISPYFFNSALFCKAKHLSKLAEAYVGAISKTNLPDVIFGPSYKGSAIAVAVSMTIGGEVGYAYDRKEVKDHGEGGIIVGDSLNGKRVGLVDDVMTTGGSLVEAFDFVRTAGGTPIWCAIAFDRQERGKKSSLSSVQEFEANYQIPVHAVATLNDLIAVLRTTKTEDVSFFRHILQKIMDYKKQYGV